MHYVIEQTYKIQLKHIVAHIQHVRPQVTVVRLRKVILRDNSWPHTTMCVKQFLSDRKITTLYYHPSSPDFSPPNCTLFLRQKHALKGHRFAKFSDIQAAVAKELKTVAKVDYSRSFRCVYERFLKCINI